MGLMSGWGTVAIHGREGFRAERAAVICLFSDWRLTPPVKTRLPKWWWSRSQTSELQPPDPERTIAVQDAANAYGVPLVSIVDSIRLGVLSELGVGQRAVSDLRDWLASTAAANDGRRASEV